MPVVVHGAESTKDSAKNRDRVAAKLSKPNLEVLLSTSETAPGLLVGEFSYKGKLVTFSKKNEGKKASGDTGVEDEEVLNVPPVTEQIKADVIVDVPPVMPSEESKPEQAISPELEAVQEKSTEVTEVKANPKEDSPLMFSSLPRLALLEYVRTTGNVVFVSPEARIWYSPLWAQEKLEEVSQVRNILSRKLLDKLKNGLIHF